MATSTTAGSTTGNKNEHLKWFLIGTDIVIKEQNLSVPKENLPYKLLLTTT